MSTVANPEISTIKDLPAYIDGLKLPPEDTARLLLLLKGSSSRQFDAIRVVSGFGVTTYSKVKEADADLPEQAIRAWAYLLEGPDGHQSLCEARKMIDCINEKGLVLPPRPTREGARRCIGISKADEEHVCSLDYQLSKPQKHQAYNDARARGAKFAECAAEDPNLARHMLDAWFELFLAAKDEAAREELRGAIYAHLTSPVPIHRQNACKDPEAVPVTAPAAAPAPLVLPKIERTYNGAPQTEWAFQEKDDGDDAASDGSVSPVRYPSEVCDGLPSPRWRQDEPAPVPEPVAPTPDAKVDPSEPPEAVRPTLTVEVELATIAGRNLEAALAEADDRKRKSSSTPASPKKSKRCAIATRSLRGTKVSDF